MSVSNLYDTSGFDNQTIDVSAASRKFQTSIIIQQDPDKSGILGVLSKDSQQETSMPNQQTSTSNQQTSIPSGGGNY